MRGPTSFEDLKTIGGVVASAFRDNSLDKCLEEASMHQKPYSLRRLFATILVYCNPSNPKLLWNKLEKVMFEDFRQLNGVVLNVRTRVLQSIASTLELMGKDINSYYLVDFKVTFDEDQMGSREIHGELKISISEEDLLAVESLNAKQKYANERILEKVFSNTPGAFFIDGPSGIGKTFLYRALLATIRSKHLMAFATASSGVAASTLLGGQTTHSRFKILLDVENSITCCVSKQNGLAKLPQASKLIIWDEAPMSRTQTIEALDKMLQDINESELPFVGKVVVFGGDFRQVLPIVPKHQDKK